MRKYQSRNFKKEYDLGQYSDLYENSLFRLLKQQRPPEDRLSPYSLDFGPVQFHVARHFGFCKGVENAIEVAYETLDQHPHQRVFMISELIHNPFVNADLKAKGLRFIKTASGKQLIPWEEIRANDIVITPAFGATVEDKKRLLDIGVDIQKWNATCRFVENVWFRARELGGQGYTIVVHGKFRHEETLATLSHSRQSAPTIVVKNMMEAEILGEFMLGKRPLETFAEFFSGKLSEGFDPVRDLQSIAVVNQTTMLATETAEISEHFRRVMIRKHGANDIEQRIANTRDTLCYATKNNQMATRRLLTEEGDLAIVIGGRNSSNTSHLVELCEEKLTTYFIASDLDLPQREDILHYDFHRGEERHIFHYLPEKPKVNILLTSGASCPDAIVERVMLRLLTFFPTARPVEEVVEGLRVRLQPVGGPLS
ncbi:MAG: 4-hydroxy-3-methylbut-2-enyl diphosphate reductase [Bacteroidota bacterium]